MPVVGIEDKREITAVLACSASGEFLKPQLIYKGSTDKCHPNFTFPDGWDVYHSSNHWSNEQTMIRYIEKIVIPYMDSIREGNGNAANRKGLCIFDVFAAHKCPTVLEKLLSNNLLYAMVPAGCTGELQPLDISVNNVFKEHMKKSFNEYYVKLVKAELDAGTTSRPVSLQLSVLKPLHAKWIVDAFSSIADKPDTLILGFRRAGIVIDEGAEDTTCSPPASSLEDCDTDCEIIAEESFASHSKDIEGQAGSSKAGKKRKRLVSYSSDEENSNSVVQVQLK